MVNPLCHFQLLVMVGVRKALDKVFEKEELRILDDVLPESQRKERLDDEDLLAKLKNLKVKPPTLFKSRG